ncbi:hypothetical protein T492DRAFT_858139, partial [Pavlovales sp. CCMP2436]
MQRASALDGGRGGGRGRGRGRNAEAATDALPLFDCDEPGCAFVSGDASEFDEHMLWHCEQTGVLNAEGEDEAAKVAAEMHGPGADTGIDTGIDTEAAAIMECDQQLGGAAGDEVREAEAEAEEEESTAAAAAAIMDVAGAAVVERAREEEMEEEEEERPGAATGVDTGAADTGAVDTGAADTGAADTGGADTGIPPSPSNKDGNKDQNDRARERARLRSVTELQTGKVVQAGAFTLPAHFGSAVSNFQAKLDLIAAGRFHAYCVPHTADADALKMG